MHGTLPTSHRPCRRCTVAQCCSIEATGQATQDAAPHTTRVLTTVLPWIPPSFGKPTVDAQRSNPNSEGLARSNGGAERDRYGLDDRAVACHIEMRRVFVGASTDACHGAAPGTGHSSPSGTGHGTPPRTDQGPAPGMGVTVQHRSTGCVVAVHNARTERRM